MVLAQQLEGDRYRREHGKEHGRQDDRCHNSTDHMGNLHPSPVPRPERLPVERCDARKNDAAQQKNGLHRLYPVFQKPGDSEDRGNDPEPVTENQ